METGSIKTTIQIKLVRRGTFHISRSEARQMMAGLEKFRTIILYFDQVPVIGQAFADEIFRVFQGRHPEIVITPKNMNETVKFWVERATGGNSTMLQWTKS